MENQTALDMINDKIKKNKAENKQTNIEMEIERGLSNDSDKYNQAQVDKKEIETIMLWKTSKLSLASIGYKAGI